MQLSTVKTFFLSVLSFAQLNLFAQPVENFQQGPPAFQGASLIGNYPNTELIFTIPTTGERPIKFSCNNIPEGLILDKATGLLRGVLKEKGTYLLDIVASNARGKAEREIRLEIGDKLCLTPPMGWNSWNVFTNTLDEALVMEIADAMVSTGMRDLGYQYINMDDFWHATQRDSTGKPIADPSKFPHGIKWLADYLHSKGLKLGIYSDAGTKTCGKCFGSYNYEEIDSKTYAEWGIDLLKYDFCHVPWKKNEAIKRYKKMGDALKHSGRSIVYSICNWGFFKPWEWGAEVGGDYWRTTPDIFDTWRGGIPFMMSTMRIIKKQNKILKYGAHGYWNDPDMLIVGNYGKGKATGRNGMFKGMSDTEYQSHMSLWAIMNAPLLASCDLRNMNTMTQNILMNPELLQINQDESGNPSQLIEKKRGVMIYKKELKHSIALAVFNRSGRIKKKSLDINALSGISEEVSAKEIWSGKEIKQEVSLSPHETKVFIVKPSNR